MTGNSHDAAPLTSAERVGELDVLRGFALLGVLIANLVWFAYSPNTATEAQLQAMGSNPLNRAVGLGVDWLVSDKANTLFAFLFGVGFWVQMERLEARGVHFRQIYLRRLTVLLLFGLINLFLIWPWDILNLYAITGFVLFALRRMPAKAMLAAGVVLALAGRPLVGLANEVAGIAGPAHEAAFGSEAVLTRQVAYVDGSYADWVNATASLVWYDWFANGLIVAWIFYALGRFLLGAYVARRGWIQRSEELLPQIRRVFRIALPLGLAIEALRVALLEGVPFEAPEWLDQVLHMAGVPILDIGYATGLILLLHSPRAKLAMAFAPVGRMALTNYLVQGFFIGFLLYGFAGLGLAGNAPPVLTLPLCILFYLAQMVFSHWWLARFRFGPMEWLWRALTYGSRPAMRRTAVGVA